MVSDLHSSGSLKTETADKTSEGSSMVAENQISISEQRLREADKRLKHVEMLLNVSRRVAIIDSLDEILVTIVEMIARELKAERGSLLLNDPVMGELYSRVAQGNLHREIRLLNSVGIAGHVFTTGRASSATTLIPTNASIAPSTKRQDSKPRPSAARR
jgi:adenylate cyclase